MSNYPLGSTVPIANPQVATTGTLTAVAQTVQATITDANTTIAFVTGTFAGVVIAWEISHDNSTWVATLGQSNTAGTPGSSTATLSTAGAWLVQTNGAAYVRARCTSYTSGTATVTFRTISIGSFLPQTSTAVDTELPAAAAQADGQANPTTPPIAAFRAAFNGTTWDRFRNNANVIADAAAAKTASGNGATQTNHNARGVKVFFNISAVSGTTPTLTCRLQLSTDGGTTWADWDTTNLQTTSITGNGNFGLTVYPGITTAANKSLNDVLPRNWRAAWTIGGTTPSFTIQTYAQYVL